jgi:hypothetical protein
MMFDPRLARVKAWEGVSRVTICFDDEVDDDDLRLVKHVWFDICSALETIFLDRYSLMMADDLTLRRLNTLNTLKAALLHLDNVAGGATGHHLKHRFSMQDERIGN